MNSFSNLAATCDNALSWPSVGQSWRLQNMYTILNHNICNCNDFTRAMPLNDLYELQLVRSRCSWSTTGLPTAQAIRRPSGESWATPSTETTRSEALTCEPSKAMWRGDFTRNLSSDTSSIRFATDSVFAGSSNFSEGTCKNYGSTLSSTHIGYMDRHELSCTNALFAMTKNACLQSIEPLANAGNALVVVDACRRLSPAATKRQRLGL